jgi:NADH-quinone oxidoreductase subunit G
MATIEIDGKSYEAQPGQMLIEITDAAGIDIPRFCYHKKLSVAASCRMCLVEVEKAPKPMPACATPVMDGMKVYTRSPKALAAQKAVMEFLLINHPLDCPICDQGGECELQDVAMGYGGSLSNYQELKRVVADKDIGPLIATEMTRCIHCTRCVRFGEEIAGIREMGATGRGEHTHIGTYIAKTVDSELSGNVIDLCPVGALTSKPFRFTARAWEIKQYPGIAPHDGLGSNIFLHVWRNRVARVAPRENEALNQVWLSDRDRFSYQALQAGDRLLKPMIKQAGAWKETDWESALAFAAEGLKKASGDKLGTLASATSTVEELYLAQKLARGLGCPNIDHRLGQADFRDQSQAPLYPALGRRVAEMEQCDAVLVIGAHLRKEIPLLNHRLRQAATRKGAKIIFLNPLAYEYNFSPAISLVAPPSAWLQELAGITKALVEHRAVKSTPAGALNLLKSAEANDTHRQIAEILLTGQKVAVLLGQLAGSHAEFSMLRALAGIIAATSNASLGYTGAANSAGAWLAGMLPHRKPGGETSEKIGLDAQAMFEQGREAYLLLGLEPELDAWNGATALESLRQAKFVAALSAFRSPAMEAYADVLLPVGVFAETSGTYVNLEGLWQSFQGVAMPPGEARPAWKVLRVLGNLLDIPGFDYTDSAQITEELRAQVGDKQADTADAWKMPESLPAPTQADGLQRIGEWPIYAVDALTRRASALQNTQDARSAQGIHLHPGELARLNLSAGQKVKLRGNGETVELEAVSDARVPAGCALVYTGLKENVPLGGWSGSLKVEK